MIVYNKNNHKWLLYTHAGVEVYRDNEHQMVIPIDCIDTQSLVFEKFDDSVFPFFEDS